MAPLFAYPLNCKEVPYTNQIEFNAEIIGSPVPEIIWYHNSTPVNDEPNSETVQVYQDGTATLKYNVITVPQEEHEFHLEATNEHGTAISKLLCHSEDGKLLKREQIDAPKILTPLSAQIVKTYSTLVLKVKFSGSPLPELQWIRNGKLLQTGDSVKIEQDTSKTSTLIVQRMERNKGGKFEVIARNKYGEARSSASVLVSDIKETPDIVAPLFVQPLQAKLVNIGDVVILEALVSSTPNCSFQWMCHGQPVRLFNDLRIVTHDNKSILIMRHFRKSLQGTYTCRAENVGGSVTSSASVHLKEKPNENEQIISPRFTKKLNSYYVCTARETLELQCQILGEPIPNVQWYHNGLQVESSENATILQHTNGICTLRINFIGVNYSGEFSCIATNNCGRSATSTIVLVQGINIGQIRHIFLSVLAALNRNAIQTYTDTLIYFRLVFMSITSILFSYRNYWNQGLSQTGMGFANGGLTADSKR